MNYAHKTIHSYLLCGSGPGSVVGIATGYGLDGPAIESQYTSDDESERLEWPARQLQ